MSASSSRSSDTDVESGTDTGGQAPRVSALWLVKFDKKVGYTLAWKRSNVDVPLENVVEFKSLPSGLHAVKQDLVYFIHEGHAGLSAFCHAPAEETERNALFVSVGVLVPLSEGRLGRSWLLAERLKAMAGALANDPSSTTPLEEFWAEQSKTPTKESSPKAESSNKHGRARALSTLTKVVPSLQSLPPFHPARSIVQYIDLFGPLVFRLQQLALLRKRILFVGAPPVQAACEYVYDLSILSSIPNSVTELLSPGTESLLRLRSLFSLGVHDIPLLEKLDAIPNGEQAPKNELPAEGWVACTTDEIIATKKQLYDAIVEIPHTHDAPAERKRWPTIKLSDGTYIKASQRDVWRYKLLQHELRKYRHQAAVDDDEDANDETGLLTKSDSNASDDVNMSFDDKVVEPMSWSRFAYLGFMWWASAGEKDAYTTEEHERDRELLGDLSDFQDGVHTAIIAYFHRTTSSLFTQVAGLIEAADDDEEAEEGEPLGLSKDDVSRIGLDTWSEADKVFVQELLWLYFGRRAEVHGTSLECCGVRIPVL